MTVVDVRIMRMPMDEPLVDVPVRVGLAGVRAGVVLVAVMIVVAMAVAVGQRLVGVLVLVALGQVQPRAGTHERSGHHEA